MSIGGQMAQSLTSLKGGWKVRERKTDQENNFKGENRNILTGKMCGKRGYCRNHIARRAPGEEKKCVSQCKSSRMRCFLRSLWRREHLESESHEPASGIWNLQASYPLPTPVSQGTLWGRHRPTGSAGQWAAAPGRWALTWGATGVGGVRLLPSTASAALTGAQLLVSFGNTSQTSISGDFLGS